MTPPALRIPDDVARLIQGLHPDIERKVCAALEAIIAVPTCGKPLKDELAGLRSYRLARFRIVYRIADDHRIEVVAIGPRRFIYDETYEEFDKERLVDRSQATAARDPQRQRRALPKPREDCASRDQDRDRALAEVFGTAAASMQTLAAYFGVSRMTASRAVKKDQQNAVEPGVTLRHRRLAWHRRTSSGRRIGAIQRQTNFHRIPGHPDQPSIVARQ